MNRPLNLYEELFFFFYLYSLCKEQLRTRRKLRKKKRLSPKGIFSPLESLIGDGTVFLKHIVRVGELFCLFFF